MDLVPNRIGEESSVARIGFNWNPEQNHEGNNNVQFRDMCELERCLANIDLTKPLVVSIASREYLKTCRLWLERIRAIPGLQWIIVAADQEARFWLEKQGAPVISVMLPTWVNEQFENRAGFNAKGIAITNLKFSLVRKIIDWGCPVIFSDIDAIIMRDPIPSLDKNCDASFQRVVYFPNKIAEKWGFAVCSGWAAFQPTKAAKALLDGANDIQKTVSSDQLALNLALWTLETRWKSTVGETVSMDIIARKERFRMAAPQRITGFVQKIEAKIEALPADIFWRHEFVEWNQSHVNVLHPNSPKNDEDKFQILTNILNKHDRNITQTNG